jgi:GDP-L-fucose synthase
VRLLITGHRGLLGSACVRRLGLKHEILTFDGNLIFSAREFIQWVNVNRPEGIIHCAAKVGGVKSNRDNPVDFLKDNLVIQDLVFDCAWAFGVSKLVFVGTSCMYPRDCPTPVKEEYLFTGPLEPSVEAYATAKIAGYELCKAYFHQYGCNFMTVAPCNLYGIGDKYGPSAHVIPALIKRIHESIKTKEPMEVWGSGDAVREFLYADDAADAIGVVLEKWNTPDLINIGTGHGTTIKGLVDHLMWIAGVGVEVFWDESQPTGIPKKTFDISKISSLGWKPNHTLTEGLAKTWNDYNCNPVQRR